jgi:hypothetical protein
VKQQNYFSELWIMIRFKYVKPGMEVRRSGDAPVRSRVQRTHSPTSHQVDFPGPYILPLPSQLHPCQLANWMIITQVSLSQNLEKLIYQNKLSMMHARIFDALFLIVMTTVALSGTWTMFGLLLARLSRMTPHWIENSLTRRNFEQMSCETEKENFSSY